MTSKKEFSDCWFSESAPTKEAAQDLYVYELLNPAAVFLTNDYDFVIGHLSIGCNFPPIEAAREIFRLTGYVMVSYCDPIMGIWKGL